MMIQKQNDTEEAMLNNSSISQNSTSQLKLFLTQGKIKTIYKLEANSINLIVNWLCQLLFLIHIVITQQLLQEEAIQNQIFNYLRQQATIYRILQGFAIIIKVIMIQSAYMQMFSDSIIIGFSWLNKKIFQSLFAIKQLDFALTAYLLLVNWQQNIVIFALSVLIDILYVLYMQNYIFRKDLFYISSSRHFIILRSFFTLGYGLNIVLLNFGSEVCFCVYQAVFSSALFSWYVIWGKNIYTHNTMRKSLLVITALQGTIALGLMEVVISDISFLDVSMICQYLLIFTVLAGVLIILESKRFNVNITTEYKGSLKDYELSIQALLQLSNSDIEVESNLYGILYSHVNLTCTNQKCPSLRDEIFDPVLKVMIKPKQIANQKDSCFRFYFRCLYENQILKNPSNKKLLLDYCEFLFNQVGNIHVLMQHLQKVEKVNLNIIEMIKISKFKLAIKQQNDRLNIQLYGGKVELQNIIESEECFFKIEGDITHYFQANLAVWYAFSDSQIHLSFFRQKIAEIFKIIQSISQSWKNISKYFSFHKQWRFVYLNFLLYIKNEKIKLKQFDQLMISAGDTNIFQNQKIYFQENNTQSSKILTENILFDSDSFSIKTYLESNQLIISEVSKYFEKNTLYPSDEIKGMPLNKLMPEFYRQPHDKAVAKWIQDGYLVDEKSYIIRFTCFLNQRGEQIPVFKYYKSHCHLQNGLQFICLLKCNIKLQSQDDNIKQQLNQKDKLNFRKDKNKSVSLSELDLQLNPSLKSMSFSSQNNIFIKEDTLQPLSRFGLLQKFKLNLRFFTFFIIVSIFVLTMITLGNIDNLINYNNQYIAFFSLFKLPIALGTYYMAHFLNLGSPITIQKTIISSMNSWEASLSQANSLKVLFDPSITVSATYTPYFSYPNISNLSYNQIDLFSVIASSISSLNTFPINRTGTPFRNFNSYFYPAYSDMMNGTKYKLHQVFDNLFEWNKTVQIIFMVTQTVVVLIFLVIIFYCLVKFKNKMNNIFQIILDFHHNDTDKITLYWQKLAKSFNTMFIQMNSQSNKQMIYQKTLALSQLRLEDKKKTKMFTSFKPQMIQGKQLLSFYSCIKIQIIVMTILIISLAIVIEVNTISTINKIQLLEINGFSYVRYFPSSTILMYGCMEKYASLLYPTQMLFNPDRYANVIASYFLVGQMNYIGQIVDPSSTYYVKQKNYYYGNPCTYNSSVLTGIGVTVKTCETVSNGTFNSGLNNFMRYNQKVGENYIQGKINMTFAALADYVTGITILSAYISDVISTWTIDFTTDLQSSWYIVVIIAIIICIFAFLLHIFINELIIVTKLSSEYNFICKVYNNFVPEYILLNEKVIRQKFVMQGLLNE